MAVTLQTLITQTVDYVKVDIDDDEYSTIETRIISALNEAKNIIARKYYPLYFTENITLDTYSSFAVSATTKTFFRLVSVTYGGAEIDTEQHASTVYCNAPASVSVAVKYQYIPEDMDALTDVYPFPDVVDFRILCYRAAQTYYEIKGTSSSVEKASLWKSKWKEALRSTLVTNDNDTIKDVYYSESSGW